MIKRSILASILLLLVASSAFAAGPNLMSYQGQVLTALGAPVANGVYPAKFEFFPVPVAGSSLWSETGTITTAAGLFTHTLGSITAIPAGFFANNSTSWLEVTVNGQIQSPRTQITSAGYSQSVNTVDSAAGGTIVGNVKVDGGLTLGTPLTTYGQLTLNSASSAFPTAFLYEYGGLGGALDLIENSGPYYGGFEPDGNGTGGYMYVTNGFGSTAFQIDGNSIGGYSVISMYGLSSVTFDLSSIANNSVILPDSAISAQEILDEPGVVSSNSFASVSPLTGTMQDITTVTVTIPAPGYIWLTGKIQEVDLLSGVMNLAWSQIDETAGGTVLTPHATLLAAIGPMYASMSSQRMYFKASAGTYTFRLEAMITGGSGSAFYPTLTAMYFPTSYGSVATLVSSSEAGSFESAKSVSSTGAGPASGAVVTDTYLVDLRELELKVAKLEAETQKAHAALAEARLKEQLTSRPAPADNKK